MMLGTSHCFELFSVCRRPWGASTLSTWPFESFIFV
jgi:hypothetical protein